MRRTGCCLLGPKVCPFAQSPEAGPKGEHRALERNSSPDTKSIPRRARALHLTGVLHSTVYKALVAFLLKTLQGPSSSVGTKSEPCGLAPHP